MLLIMLYKVVQTFESVDEITIQTKATEQYFPVVLFIMLYKVVLTFESADEILKCDHCNESYWAVLSCGTVYYAVQGGSNFWVCGWNPRVWPLQWKLLSKYFPVVLFIMLYKVVLTFESVDEILKSDWFKRKLLSSSFLLFCYCSVLSWLYTIWSTGSYKRDH